MTAAKRRVRQREFAPAPWDPGTSVEWATKDGRARSGIVWSAAPKGLPRARWVIPDDAPNTCVLVDRPLATKVKDWVPGVGWAWVAHEPPPPPSEIEGAADSAAAKLRAVEALARVSRVAIEHRTRRDSVYHERGCEGANPDRTYQHEIIVLIRDVLSGDVAANQLCECITGSS